MDGSRDRRLPRPAVAILRRLAARNREATLFPFAATRGGPLTTADAWDIDETDFPSAGTPAEQLAHAVRYAVLAPSSHNSQPWLFHLEGDELELRADRTRALPVVDPDDRELVMSCGAALFHLRIALRGFGLLPEVRTLAPPPAFDPLGLRSVPDVLARIEVRAGSPPTADEEALFRAIPRRHTNRARFLAGSVGGGLVAGLVRAAEEEGAWLVPIDDDPRREALADLVARADAEQAADPRFRRELAAWVHPGRARSGDGMPAYALGLHGPRALLAPLVVRTFDWGDGRAASDRQLAEGSPLLAILGTSGDGPSAWLEAGQALDRVLLRACASDLQASFLNQPVELPHLRNRVSEVAARPGFPHIVLRLGVGPEVNPTPRRPLEEVWI